MNLKYRLIKSKRKTISFLIDKKGQLVVKAPNKASNDIIEKAIIKNSNWINKKTSQIKKIIEQKLTNHIYYLGKQYLIEYKIGEKEAVDITNYKLMVTGIKPKTEEYQNMILHRFFRTQARKILTEEFEACLKSFKHYNGTKPTLKFRTTKSKWGSCSSNKVITLNHQLIHTPTECIRGVIYHELCHLLILNHSKDFYDLLKMYYPEHKKYKEILNQFIYLI